MFLRVSGLFGFILLFILITEHSLIEAQTNRAPTDRALPPTLPVPPLNQQEKENYNPLKNCAPPEDPTSYQNRLQEYQTSLEGDPDDPDILQQLGVLHSRLLQWDEAQNYFFKALTYSKTKRRPDKNQTSEIYRQLGDLYACQQQFDKAIDQYKQSIRSSPQAAEENHSDVKHNLALTQLLAQQQEQKNSPQKRENQSTKNSSNDSAQQNDSQTESSSQEQSPQTKDNREEELNASKDQSENEAPSNDSEQPDQIAPSDSSKNKDEPNEKEASQAVAKNNEDQEDLPNEDSQTTLLSRQQAEQLLNSVSENRQKFIQRLLKRQAPPPTTDKNW